MRADLKRIKLLFKAKIQAAITSNGQGGDERHSIEVDRRMHSGEAKIADLVGEKRTPTNKIKNQNGRGRVRAESRK
jgi:hypothetical protein